MCPEQAASRGRLHPWTSTSWPQRMWWAVVWTWALPASLSGSTDSLFRACLKISTQTGSSSQSSASLQGSSECLFPFHSLILVQSHSSSRPWDWRQVAHAGFALHSVTIDYRSCDCQDSRMKFQAPAVCSWLCISHFHSVKPGDTLYCTNTLDFIWSCKWIES